MMSDGETSTRMPTVLDRADKARLVLEPYPHIVIENALPDDVYQQLSAAFPPLSDLDPDLARTSNKRFNLYASWGPTELPKDQTPGAWQSFLDAHTSTDFVRKVFDLFSEVTVPGDRPGSRKIRPDSLGEGLAEMLKLPQTVGEEDIIARATVAINTPVTATPNSVRGPHIDSLWKAYVGLYYVRSAEDDSVGGDLNLYRWKPGARPDRWSKKADPEQVEIFDTVRYSPNTYVLMLNSHNSLHGVTIRQPTPHVRRFAVTSGWFPGVDEGSLLGRRRGVVERLKALIRPIIAKPTVAEYQD